MPIETTPLYKQAYAEYLEHAHDPVWLLAMEIYLGETFQQMAQYHQGQIQAIADKVMHQELGQMRKALTKQYLSTRIEEIQKSTKKQKGQWNKEGYWTREHGRFARYNGPKMSGPEDPRTRWSRGTDDPKEFLRQAMHHAPPRDVNEARQRATGMNVHSAEELPVANNAEHAREVFERTAQMHNDLFARTNDPRDKQRIQYVIQHPDGTKRIEIPKAGELPEVHYAGGERVHFMTPVGPDNPVHAGGKAINIGLVAGMSSEQAAKVGGVTQGIHDVMGQTTWGKKMQATAQTLATISGGASPFTQAAAFAQMVNIIGPQASRAFGGKLRQLTYRYTGQEVPQDEWSPVATAGRQANSKGELESTRSLEYKLVTDLVNRQKVLPTKTQFANSLKAGSTPPSKGYILDKDGKVASEAVGYSDDWYTPFNLKKLPQMRGGSYVRTRAYGGLTPEDIRMAMRTGAERATVVSNNGVFTMEFNPKTLHWGHRWGFAGGAMVRRYAKSLDAIKNSQITDPSRQGGAETLKLNAEGYKAAMTDLRMKYPIWVRDPQSAHGVETVVETADGRREAIKGFHAPLHHLHLGGAVVGGERQGDTDLDTDGYISPVQTRATGAMHGWYEPGVGTYSMWESPTTGKVAYNDIDRYQVHHDTYLNAHRLGQTLRGTGPAGGQQAQGGQRSTQQQQGGAPRPRPAGAPTSAPVQGAGRVVRSTDENKVDADETDKWLREVKRFIGQAGTGSNPVFPRGEIDSGDEQMTDLLDVLSHPGPINEHPKYQKVLGMLANSKQARDHVNDVLQSVYAEGDLGGRSYGQDDIDRLLIGIQDLPVREDGRDDEVAPAEDTIEGRYDRTSVLSLKRIRQLENREGSILHTWLNTRAGDREKALYTNWKDAMAKGGRRATAEGDERKAFDTMNGILAEVLNHQEARDAAAEEGEVVDTGEQTQGGPVTSSTLERPEDHVNAFINQLQREHPGVPLTDETVEDKVLGKMTEHQEAVRAKQPGYSWHEQVLKELQTRIDNAYAAKKRIDEAPSDDEIDQFGQEHGLSDEDWS